MKHLSVLCMCIVLSGCGLTEAVTIAGGITAVICGTTTEQGRADIRDKQKLPTDICGDLRGGE